MIFDAMSLSEFVQTGHGSGILMLPDIPGVWIRSVPPVLSPTIPGKTWIRLDPNIGQESSETRDETLPSRGRIDLQMQ
jgi:hypothetical protein